MQFGQNTERQRPTRPALPPAASATSGTTIAGSRSSGATTTGPAAATCSARGNGFNHLFPLAHKYLGYMDLFGRSNIQSPNVQLTMQPHPKVKLLAWYYYLFLDTRADTPYTVAMTPVNPGNAPAQPRPGSRDRPAGHDLAQAADGRGARLLALLLGRLLPPDARLAVHTGDADFFYAQYHVNF